MAIKLHASFAVHPGEWLKAEIVQPYGLSVTALADTLKVTRQAVSKLLNGHAGLSAEMAIRFERHSGCGPTRCCGCRPRTTWRKPARMKGISRWSGR